MAKANGIKIYVNLDWVKVGSTGGRIIWLKEEEIKKMEEYYYSSFIPEHLKLSLGYFLFSCYTGLRISDVMEGIVMTSMLTPSSLFRLKRKCAKS